MKSTHFPFRSSYGLTEAVVSGKRMQLFHLMTPLACGREGRAVLGTDLPVTSSKCQRYVPELDLGFDAAAPQGAS